MEKITFMDAVRKISKHNQQFNITKQFEDDDPLKLVIVFSKENWETNYSLKSRSYLVRSDNKFFLPSMMGNSLFGTSLDGKDVGVRLDWYMFDWSVDYCYFIDSNLKSSKDGVE